MERFRRLCLLTMTAWLLGLPAVKAFASLGPFDSPEVYAIVIDPRDSNTIYAGTEDGVYKTTDAGQSWVLANTGIPSHVYSNMVIDPWNSNVVYMGTVSDGVYKTINGGQSWFAVNNGISHPTIKYIVFDPSYYPLMYAGTFSRMNRSYDGANWTPLESLDGGVLGIALDPSRPGTIYAASNRFGLVKSTNYGQSWFDTNLPGIAATVAVDPFHPQVVLAATWNGAVYRSGNGGSSWTQVLVVSNGADRVIFDPTNSNVAYAAFSYTDGVYKSSDNGLTWSSASQGLTNLWVYDIAVDPLNPSTVYAATYGDGVFVSYDAAATWN